ncbi:MAG: VWA domain-containing protein [Thermomicrobiales bacterium]
MRRRHHSGRSWRVLALVILGVMLFGAVTPPAGAADFPNTDTVLVLDVSGSMGILAEIPQDFPHRDEYQASLTQIMALLEGRNQKKSLHDLASGAQSGVKLAQLQNDIQTYFQTHQIDPKTQSRHAAAQRAAKSYLDLLELSRQNAGTTNRVSLVTFESTLGKNDPLTANRDTIRQELDTLEPLGGTNMGAGLQAALAQLAQAPPGTKQQIILLTDGYNNEGMTNQEILDGPAQTAKARNIPIYTVGFGLLPITVDEQFLSDLAHATNGAYLFADSPDKLAADLLTYQGYSSSQVLARFEGDISTGQSLAAGEMTVPAGKQTLRMAVRSTPGTQVEISLTGPDGKTLSKSDSSVTLAKQGDVTLLTVTKPAAGVWHIGVLRQDLSANPAHYAITASTEGVTTNLPIANVVAQTQGPDQLRTILLIASVVLGVFILIFVILALRGLFSQRASTAGGCFSGCLTVLLVIAVAAGWGGYYLWNKPLFGP